MLKKFPGFIDIHVHLREPGATQKEDFLTGSRAAIKGGFTYILDMPNNPLPTFTPKALKQKIMLAKKSICDVGFHYGTNGKNTETFSEAWQDRKVFGLKLYCNHTTGDYLIDDIHLLEKVFRTWKSTKPILVHAEGKELAAVIGLAHLYNRHLHVCHVSQAIEVEFIRKAKYKKQWITAGVTPHHLFLADQEISKIGSFALMKPPLNNKKNQGALWEGIEDGTIDLVESDHAPHTLAEKKNKKPAYGVPGLETTVGLLFKAVKENKLAEKKIVELLFSSPKKIFNIPEQEDTFIELDPDKEWIVQNKQLETKCKWSPFMNWTLYGRVETVILRGKTLMQKSKITV